MKWSRRRCGRTCCRAVRCGRRLHRINSTESHAHRGTPASKEVHYRRTSFPQYLEAAELAVVLGNTLFVHGAVDRQTLGAIPDDSTRFELPAAPPPVRRHVCKKSSREVSSLSLILLFTWLFAARALSYSHYAAMPQVHFVDSVGEWVAGLNAFLARGLADHAAQPEWDAARTTRGGQQLVAIQNRQAVWGRSIISNCYCDGGTITSGAAARKRPALLEKAPDRCAPLTLTPRCCARPPPYFLLPLAAPGPSVGAAGCAPSVISVTYATHVT